MNDILGVVWKYTDIFNEKTVYGFGKWCNSRKSYLTQKDTVNHFSRYQIFIQNLKDENYHVRKSVCEKDDALRVRFKVFASIHADGDMQDMLMYISSMERVCIVTIDFEELPTNCEDLKAFLNIRNNPNTKKLMIDRFASCEVSHVYDTQELFE
ncbi:MAG: hypothetical protein EXX96DRAFT_509332 [Benjaminiella poitrasii]|nr:MAG: hypothetical protein EXX96DRAFT_509332 [Benjaminiella poitrasii]